MGSARRTTLVRARGAALRTSDVFVVSQESGGCQSSTNFVRKDLRRAEVLAEGRRTSLSQRQALVARPLRKTKESLCRDLVQRRTHP